MINDNVVSQAIELVDDGAADEALMVMKDVITLTYRGKPRLSARPLARKNYINAIKEHAVTICIGPAGTGKTYLAIAMAVDALKKRGNFPDHPDPACRGSGRAPGIFSLAIFKVRWIPT